MVLKSNAGIDNSYQKGFIVNKDMRNFVFLKCGSQITKLSIPLQIY